MAICESNIPGEKRRFQIYYDYLVVAVGAATNTFGTPGRMKRDY